MAQYRVTGGREVVETIGTTAVLPKIADARERARHSLLKAKDGVNPVAERKAKQAAAAKAAAAQALAFGVIVERYIAEYCLPNLRPRSVTEVHRLLRRAASFFGDKPAGEIGKQDILDLLAQPPLKQPGVARQGGLRTKTNILKVVRRVFAWAVDLGLIPADPSAGIKKPLKGVSERERVLSDGEIVAFWHECDRIAFPFGPLFQMLLLTGQRWTEVAAMPWAELDQENCVWHLPAARAKNKQAHDVHLSDAVMQIIEGLPKSASRSGEPVWLFTVDGDHPVKGYWWAKMKLVKAIGASDWEMHDLRRTAVTLMARCKVEPHVADRVINHVQGTIKGVARVYNRFTYWEERVAALDKLGAFVTRLVKPEDNVVTLRSA